jgi:chromosome segregation ATPase
LLIWRAPWLTPVHPCAACGLQIITLKESFTTAKQHLMREQLASRTHAATAAELQQRLANLRATGSKSVTSAVVVVDDAREHTQAMVQEAVRTAQQLEKVTGEVQELRHKLAAESASKVEYQKTTEELKQRLANLHATGERHAAAAQAAAAAMAAARGSRGSRGSSVSCDSDTGRYSRPPSPSVEVDKLRQQHQKELQDLQEQLTAAVAAAEEAGHAALAQQQEQLELLQQQLAASRVQAEAAQAAEEVAREQVLALREQLRQQQDALDAQGQALKVARDEMMRLKERAAHFGEACAQLASIQHSVCSWRCDRLL